MEVKKKISISNNVEYQLYISSYIGSYLSLSDNLVLSSILFFILAYKEYFQEGIYQITLVQLVIWEFSVMRTILSSSSSEFMFHSNI
jgi:hypothetical protein